MLYARIFLQTKTFSPSRPPTRFSAIDRLDGFDPGDLCLCRRFLVPVQINGSSLPAFLYVDEDPISGRLNISTGITNLDNHESVTFG